MQRRKLVDLMHNHVNRHIGEVEKRGGVIASKSRLVVHARRAVAIGGSLINLMLRLVYICCRVGLLCSALDIPNKSGYTISSGG